MRTRKILGTLAVVVMICQGCQVEVSNNRDSQGYFNVDSLLNKQLINSDQKITISKRVSMNGAFETREVEMDSTTLAEELDILGDVDINKSNLVGVYDKSVQGDKIIYKKKSSEEPGSVQWLEISENGNDLTISSQVIDENSIYQTTRDYQMTFKAGNLVSYEISGIQKMVLSDTTTFTVEVKF